MEQNMPNTPFSTRLSGSAKEIELRIRSMFQWKKKRPPVGLLVLAAALVLLCFTLVSCETAKEQSGFVLDTDKEITAITIHTSINDRGAIPAPEEYVDELADWVRKFEIGEAVKGTLPPGSGSAKLELTYADGTTEILDISTVERDGMRYYINAPAAPKCWMELVNGSGGQGQAPNTELPPEGSSLVMPGVLKNLGWENTCGMATGGAADHEMAMTGEVMELFGSVAGRLTSVDKPDKFSTILGGVTLWLSKDKGERINFYPGEHYPNILVNYVTDTVKEYASVEDITLYSFLVAAVEKKYVELHDLDDDGSFETVQWDSKNKKRFLVIFDVYDGQIQRIDANEALGGVGATDYSGQIGNIRSEYNNLIVADMEDGTSLYRYDGLGQFSFVCTLEEASRT